MATYYLTYYQPEAIKNLELEISPASQQKAKYIIEKLDEIENDYTVVCLAEAKIKHGRYASQAFELGKHGRYILWQGFGKPNRIVRKMHFYYRRKQLKQFLLGLNESDLVIAYHSLQTADIFFKMKRKRNFRLMLELEEIYQDVVNCGRKKANWERKIVSEADGYILATEALSKAIAPDRPYIVINGTYHAEPDRKVRFNDEKTHCVYAGTFDPSKGGAAAAVAAAEFLPEKYHVHILGFGTEEQTRQLKEQISAVQKKTACTLTYDGLKSGEEFIQFLQKCHIGLCTQIPDAKYTETSFPSKILVYLANGLRVLSVRIPAVENSEVGSILYYYDEQKPEIIAKAIMGIDVGQAYDSRMILRNLDEQCVSNIKNLVEKMLS